MQLAATSSTHEQLTEIGKKIWSNECNQSVEKLTWWNDHEDFASLGIGHFIWYPEGKNGRFTQTFPDLVQFLISKKITVPQWLLGQCPWQNKKAFFDDFTSEKMTQLRLLLKNSIPEQTAFLILQLESITPKLLQKAHIDKKSHISRCFNTLLSYNKGTFALIDYLNFKGSGLNPLETYQGKGWGLLQVLEQMPYNQDENIALESFINTGKKILHCRVDNAPQGKSEKQWLPGWINRLESYK